MFCVTESAECAVQGCSCNNGGYTATQAQFAPQHITSPAGSYSNCTAYNYKYITAGGSYLAIPDCQTCSAGYQLIAKSYDFSQSCGYGNGTECVINYSNCSKCDAIGNYYDSSSKQCKACTNAPSNATYTSNGGTSATGCSWQCNAGYYKNSNTCTKCAAGTYSSAGATACTSCKTTTNNTSATSAEGSTTINDCYVPKTAQFTNTSGTWHYTDNCYYK